MNIPVEFCYNGITYRGSLESVIGTGYETFHLSVDGFYWGRLWYVPGSPGFNGLHSVPAGWKFDSNKPGLEELADYFERVIIAAGE